MIGDLSPRLVIDKAATQDQDRRETLADVMVRHIGEQMRLASPGFARDEQSMLVRQPADWPLDFVGNFPDRLVKLIDIELGAARLFAIPTLLRAQIPDCRGAGS